MNTAAIDTLGGKLSETALRLVINLYPNIRSATNAELDAACAAMRAMARSTVDELLAAAQSAPGVSHLAFQSAALTLAHEGVRVLRAGCR